MSEHPSKSTGRRPSLTKPSPPPAPRKAQATAKKSQAATHKAHSSSSKPQAAMHKNQALAKKPQASEPSLEASQPESQEPQEPQGPTLGSIDDEVNNLSIASLTLDTPLIPLRKKPPRVPATPFHFLSLPTELRIKIYEYYFEDDNEVIDLSPQNYKRIHKKLGLMRVCKLLHKEATYYYYGTRTFRIFPTYPGKYFKTKRPLLARLKPRQRECLTTLELRLGPGWNAPPNGWAVNEALGLGECVRVRKVKVLVECDPSDNVFKGFRRSNGFYEGFSQRLLTDVLAALPAVAEVEFDAWSSVKKSGAMMSGLIKVASETKGVAIKWGPERGWTDADEDDDATVAGSDPNRPLDSVPIPGFENLHGILVEA